MMFSTVARVLASVGLVDPNRRKRPKSSYRSIRTPFPMMRWQIDAFGWRLSDGQPVVVHEVLDDCTRKHLAVLAAQAETVAATLQVLSDAIQAWGRPHLVHSDNGGAINPSRFRRSAPVVEFLHAQGINTLTGRPGTPARRARSNDPTRDSRNGWTTTPLLTWASSNRPATTLRPDACPRAQGDNCEDETRKAPHQALARVATTHRPPRTSRVSHPGRARHQAEMSAATGRTSPTAGNR